MERRVSILVALFGLFVVSATVPVLANAQQTMIFGEQAVGTLSDEQAVPGCCHNFSFSGSVFSFDLTGDFRRGPDSTCGFILGPDESCVFYVVFAPSQAGNRTGALIFKELGFIDTVVTLVGTGVADAGIPAGSSRHAFLGPCQGSFITGCSTVLSSMGARIDHSGTASSSGESVNYTATAVSEANSLGGSVSLTSQTLNPSGPGIMVQAVANMVDVITISFPPWDGTVGTMELRYTLHGNNSASGVDATARFGPHRVPYACVKLGTNEPLFPFGCIAHDSSQIDGTFSAGFVTFVYGKPFPLWFELESIAGTGFGPGRPTGGGSSAASFLNTATLEPFTLFGPDMQPLVGTPTITSNLGLQYSPLQVVDSLVQLNAVSGRFVPPAGGGTPITSVAAGGEFRIDATFINHGSSNICHIAFQVETLEGNPATPMMLTQSGDPIGTQGITVSATDAGAPDHLLAQAQQQFHFRIGVARTESINFLVHMLGVPEAGTCGP